MVYKGLEAVGTLVLAGSSRCSGVSGEYGIGTRTVGHLPWQAETRSPLPPNPTPGCPGPLQPVLREKGGAAALAPLSGPINY